jgi:transposase
VAIDGSKFRAVTSARTVREREQVKRWLEQLERADEQDEVVIDPQAVQAALDKLKRDPEPEARFMRMADRGFAPAYNVQTAVDAGHALTVAQQVTTEATDNRSLQPMAEAAKQALDNPETLNVIADAGYSNGEQAEGCEQQGILPHVPAQRGFNNKGDGTLFDRSAFRYDQQTDTFLCPGGETLVRKQLSRKDRCVMYAAPPEACSECALKSRCTTASRRWITRHLHEEALTRMRQRATPEAMRLRRSTVEHPFATLKYRIFGHPRFLLRGLAGARTEIGLATMAWNLKRMIRVMGATRLRQALG